MQKEEKKMYKAGERVTVWITESRPFPLVNGYTSVYVVHEALNPDRDGSRLVVIEGDHPELKDMPVLLERVISNHRTNMPTWRLITE